MNKYISRLLAGIFKENPTFVLLLGMCPTLAVTTSAINGAGMGLSTMIVLICSNVIISLFRKAIPNMVRIPIFIIIVATFVTIIQFLISGFVPSLNDSLGVYIPLIVVNCIILGRAEAFASKNGPVLSLMDGIGMGVGFTIALTILGAVREILGSGCVFGFRILPEEFSISIFVLAPGAFFVLAILVAIMNKIKIKKGKPPVSTDCKSCGLCPGSQAACGKENA